MGITEAIPWEFNQRWPEVVAAGGTISSLSAQKPARLSASSERRFTRRFTRGPRPARKAFWQSRWIGCSASCPARWIWRGKILEWDLVQRNRARRGRPRTGPRAAAGKSPAVPKELRRAEEEHSVTATPPSFSMPGGYGKSQRPCAA